MKSKGITTLAVVSIWAIIVLAAVGQGQANKNSTPPEVQRAVLARLAEIQAAAEKLDPDKVFSFVMENDAGALAQNGRLFLTRQEALESTKRGFQRLEKIEYRFDQQHVTSLSPSMGFTSN